MGKQIAKITPHSVDKITGFDKLQLQLDINSISHIFIVTNDCVDTALMLKYEGACEQQLPLKMFQNNTFDWFYMRKNK